MAIFHLSMKAISRSDGRSAVAAAAYRSATMIECEREGVVHDYQRRRGVSHSEIIVPAHATWAQDRSALWNAAEFAEKRVNSTVAREYEVALPAELSAQERIDLVRAFGEVLAERYGVAVDFAIHAPNRAGDQRNWHAHVMTSTRVATADGFGAKTRILDDRKTGPLEVTQLRETWADLANERLAQAQSAERIDHRSLADQRAEQLAQAEAFEAAGQLPEAIAANMKAAVLDRAPQAHVGVAATAMERRAAHEAFAQGYEPEPVTELGALRAAAQAEQAERLRLVERAREALQELWERVQAAYQKLGKLVQGLRAQAMEFGSAEVAKEEQPSPLAPGRGDPAEIEDRPQQQAEREEPPGDTARLSERLEALKARRQERLENPSEPQEEGALPQRSNTLAAAKRAFEQEQLTRQVQAAREAFEAERLRQAEEAKLAAQAQWQAEADRQKLDQDEDDVARERGPSMRQ